MFYDRKIKYLDYYENGGRVKGGGFVKLEAREGRLRVEVSVNGLHATDTFARDVMLCGEGQESAIGKITVKGGRGQFRQMYGSLEDIDGTGISYGGLQGIRIPLGGGRELSCIWDGQGIPAGGGTYAGGSAMGRASMGDSAVGRNSAGGSAVDNASVDNSPVGETIAGGFPVDRMSADASGRDRGSIGGSAVDKTFAGGLAVDKASAGGLVVDKASADGLAVDKASAGGLAVDKAPRGSSAIDKALAGGLAVDKAFTGGSVVDKAPRGSSAVDRALADGLAVDNVSADTRNVDRSSEFSSSADNTSPGESAVHNPSMSSMGKGRTAADRAGGNEMKMAERGLNGRRTDSGKTAEGGRRTGAGETAAGGRRTGAGETAEGGRRTGAGETAAGGRQTGAGETAAGGRRTGSDEAAAGGRERQPVKLLEDKWQQLCAIYPHVTPFHDKREYLSISPADFVIFPSASYKLVNNSFLLHGYYNYRHLILARMEKKGEICYYIGVPGTFFEKEKQVAVMFGFESFECGEEPAQTGDFGYYMMRTQL